MLLKLGTTILLIPLFLFLDCLESLLKVVRAGWRGNSERGKLLDDGEVEVELLVLCLRCRLLSALALVLLAATDLHHVLGLALSLRLADLNLASIDLLVQALLDGLLLESGLGSTGCVFIVNDEAKFDLLLSDVADQMVARVDLLRIRVGKRADECLLLSLAHLSLCLLVHHTVFLPLHPLNVLDLLVLHLEVVATLPVSFAQIVLLLVERVELFLDAGDLLVEAFNLLASLVLLSIGLLELLADGLHLGVQDVLLFPNLLDLAEDLVLFIFELLDLRLNGRQFLGMGN